MKDLYLGFYSSLLYIFDRLSPYLLTGGAFRYSAAQSLELHLDGTGIYSLLLYPTRIGGSDVTAFGVNEPAARLLEKSFTD